MTFPFSRKLPVVSIFSGIRLGPTLTTCRRFPQIRWTTRPMRHTLNKLLSRSRRLVGIVVGLCSEGRWDEDVVQGSNVFCSWSAIVHTVGPDGVGREPSTSGQLVDDEAEDHRIRYKRAGLDFRLCYQACIFSTIRARLCIQRATSTYLGESCHGHFCVVNRRS